MKNITLSFSHHSTQKNTLRYTYTDTHILNNHVVMEKRAIIDIDKIYYENI